MLLTIVCPFCDGVHPIPTDFECMYNCSCGACYKICSSKLLESGMTTMAREIWSSDPSALFEDEKMALCQVVVNREFDQLISLKQTMDDRSELRFCKYDPSEELALVWMKRPF
jgi:ferredoxin